MDKIALYQPDRYPVILGTGSSAALCTVWNDATELVRKNTWLEQKCAIIGTLYTRSGIAPLIRNLALNPAIRRLYLWANGDRSNTEHGRSGSDVLRSLWCNGIMTDGQVPDTSYKLESEIDPEWVKRIIKDVELILVGYARADDLEIMIDDRPIITTRETRAFPDPPDAEEKRWPAESVGRIFRGRTIIEAWQKLLAAIMRYGVEKGTQYGMRQRELTGAVWVIDNEDPDRFAVPSDWPDELKAVTGTTNEMIKGYLPQILTADGDLSTYGHRLHCYPIGNDSIDQVRQVLFAGLQNSPDCRRAVATTMIPASDWNSKNPPCLTTIQCLQADGHLNMIVNFRSHDIFKGALPNAQAMRIMQKIIGEQLGFKLGSLMLVSASAHVYENDWSSAGRLVDCAENGQDPLPEFKAEDADPRGNVVINLVGKMIKIILRGPDGAQLWDCENASAAKIMAKIAQLGLIVDPGHLMYIGAELMKAEIAASFGLVYEQDR